MPLTRTPILLTKRLILRPFRTQDARAVYYNWTSDPLVTRFLSWLPHENIAATRSILMTWEMQVTDSNHYLWAICLKDDIDNPLGSIGLTTKDASLNQYNVGYALSRSMWGQGIVSEALQEVVRCAFEDLKLHHLFAQHDVFNPTSGEVLKKSSFQKIGLNRQSFKNNLGYLIDTIDYQLLSDDYDLSLEHRMPVLHTMHLDNEPFNAIVNGTKTVEFRLNDAKRSKVKVGDAICFIHLTDPNQSLTAEVTRIHQAEDFETLFKTLPEVRSFDPASMEIYYSREDQKKYGVLGFELNLIQHITSSVRKE